MQINREGREASNEVRLAVQSIRSSLLEAATGQTSQKTTPGTAELHQLQWHFLCSRETSKRKE